MTADELKELLEKLPNVEAPVVQVQGQPPRLLAMVTSSSFADVDEAERQERVWAHLRAHRADDAPDVEFIFTNASGEPS